MRILLGLLVLFLVGCTQQKQVVEVTILDKIYSESRWDRCLNGSPYKSLLETSEGNRYITCQQFGSVGDTFTACEAYNSLDRSNNGIQRRC